MHRLITTLLGTGLIVAAASTANAEAVSSPIGQKVENFTLQDFRGTEHSLSDFGDSKLVVVAYLGTECPLAKLYCPRLVELSEEYGKKGVAFVGIDANRQDSITELAAYARIHNLDFPLLKDLGNQVADQMGAVRTPEVFVLDQDRKIRYWGRIDDQYLVGLIRDEPSRQDLRLALDQLLAGEDVEVPVTESMGCYIGRVRDPNENSDITYSNQIARIFQNRCVECHREGEIAPFALSDYDEVAGWGETIAEVVRDERMPPWHASAEHGDFVNDRRMSDGEKQMIYDWVAAGSPEGDPAELPEPREYTEGWQLPREPDMVVAMADEEYSVPAEGVVEYQYFTTDPGFTEDKWVTASEVIPGNRAVVHHVLIFVRSPEDRGSRGGDGLGFVAAYVPGYRTDPLPKGMAKRIPAGSKLIWQVHYTPIGSEQKDLCKVGFVFAEPGEVTHMVQTVEAMEQSFAIPPHEPNHRVDATSSSYPRETLLLSMSPHMHLRGKAFRYEARYPDGKSEVLLDVPNYDFNWQTSYRLTEMKEFPKGTRMYCVAHFDNSEDNLANPDPTKTVRWGDQTFEEMMIGFYDVAVPLTEEEQKSGKVEKLRATANSQAERLLGRFDENQDGKVTKDEVPERAAFLFLTLDKNADGVLTAEEVAKAIEERSGKQD